MNQIINRIKTMLKILNEARFDAVSDKIDIYQKSIGYDQRYVMNENINFPGWNVFENGSLWGGHEKHDCFKAFFVIPSEMNGRKVVFHVSTGATDIWNTDNPQFIVYRNNQIACAMDMNHNELCVSENASAGEKIEIGLYAYSNSTSRSDYLKLSYMIKYPEVEKLYYDCKVPFEVAVNLAEEDLRRSEILDVLNSVMNQLELRKGLKEEFLKSVISADEWLQNHFYNKLTGKSDVTVHSIGHTHIDVAWKWRIRQTREKAVRSFANVLHLMDEYDEYRFMSSQPQLYEFVKEEAPELYEKIRQRIKEKRWEPEGSMWVEADCNIPSGESLVRQIIYGKKFFKEEFDISENRVLWLPDVFGYNAAMPQIMRKSGIRYFMTTKINWNESNKMPNDVMYWKGIDGSKILTYFISTTDYVKFPENLKKDRFETTYNGRQNADQVMGTWQRFSNKNLTSEVLTCYGYGDGGGGPTAQMLEESRRMEKGIPGCPVTKQTFAREYFEKLEQNLAGKKVPEWSGELYLEYHRGTYTSMARNKKYNRRCEFLNNDAEFFSVLAMCADSSYCYPEKELNRAWKLTLLNQFHDILPGSAIKEVYEDSKQQYQEIIAIDKDVIRKSESYLDNCTNRQDENSIVFYNACGVNIDDYISLSKEEFKLIERYKQIGYQIMSDGKYFVKLPAVAAKSAVTADALFHGNKYVNDNENCGRFERTENGYTLETSFYMASFDMHGNITCLYDKTAGREIGIQGRILNQLTAYEDKPYEYDAWNIDEYYEEKSWNIDEISEFRLSENGPLMCEIHVERPFMSSKIIQNIRFYRDKKRIDFHTVIDWKEEQILLKAAFPIDVLSSKVVCDIQFGNIERTTCRNTSWDQAKFEMCAHKWIDIAEDGYGVALLNDCKYGFDARDTTIRLTLLKSGIFPNPDADKEMHEFTYSLLPHEGDFRKGHVVQESYALNTRIYQQAVCGKPSFGDAFKLVSIDCENVIPETIKKSEYGSDIILRMFECYGRRSRVRCDVSGIHARSACFCNLIEEENDGTDQEAEHGMPKNILHEDGTIDFEIRPYEIRTIKLKR